MRWLSLLLPVAALLAVGIMLGVVVGRESGGGPFQSVVSSAAPADNGEPAARPRLEPQQSVCQGILHRPLPGEERTFPSMYTQRIDVNGIAVVAPPGVAPEALETARATIEHMFAANNLDDALAAEDAYVAIADDTQQVLDLPEFRCLGTRPDSGVFDNVCGVADHADYPVATVNELDLEGDERGPCGGLNILYHELGHLVQNFALGPADYYDVRLMYQSALDAGKYDRQYASTNPHEYFAEGTQNYFLYGDPDGERDRAWLQQYDPDLFELLDRVYSQP
ncbi:MAG: hypothetical protein ACM3S1_07260 [Hyphomicrobiales bacterium]